MMRVSQAEAHDLEIGQTINVLDKLIDVLYDGNWWTIDKVAHALNVSKGLVERAANFYSWFGAVKYWREKGIVKISEKLLELERSQIPLIPLKIA